MAYCHRVATASMQRPGARRLARGDGVARPKAVNGCSAGPLLGSRETLRLWLPVMLLTALRIIGCVRMTAN